jgi:hypothetical protein
VQTAAADRNPFAQNSLSTIVLGRIEETWKLQIIAPFSDDTCVLKVKP